jgi:hypothetical protein
MFAKDTVITLTEVETRQTIQTRALNNAGFTINFQPIRPLREFNSYQIIIHSDTKDNAENPLKKDHIIQFIVAPL